MSFFAISDYEIVHSISRIKNVLIFLFNLSEEVFKRSDKLFILNQVYFMYCC